MKKNYRIVVLIIWLIISCGEKKVPNCEIIPAKHTSKEIDSNAKIIVNYDENRINLDLQYIKENTLIRRIKTYKRINNQLYEQRPIQVYPEFKTIDSISVLSFSSKDTSFDYIDRAKYPHSTMPRGWDDWHYTITSNKLTKINISDSNFVEEYYFDNLFRIKRVNLFYGTDTLIFSASE
jgi:hypothetical protein